MTVVYATNTDYTVGPPERVAPDNIATLLYSASLLIAEQTVNAYYDADDDGIPTDEGKAAALTEATCVQAALWAGLGVDPNLGGLDSPAPKRSKGIGTARVEYDTSIGASVTAFEARRDLIGTLCPEAQRILRAAGLLPTRVWTYG